MRWGVEKRNNRFWITYCGQAVGDKSYATRFEAELDMYDCILADAAQVFKSLSQRSQARA